MISRLIKYLGLLALAVWAAVVVGRVTASTVALQLPGKGIISTTNPATTTSTQTASISNTTRNWAGYVASAKTFTAIHGTWTVPQVGTTGYTAADATWIGIGGTSTGDLIQTGTQNVVDASGNVQVTAWYELLPDSETPVALNVSPGDSITAGLTQVQTGTWQISLRDNTTGQSYATHVQYDSSNASAEWVEEDPSDGNAQVPLDNFGTVSFTNATATANGQTISAQAAGAQTMTMVAGDGQQLANISTLSSGGKSFSVTRTSASSISSSPYDNPTGTWHRHGMGPGGSGGHHNFY